jgi:hypothetical protein
MQAVSALNEPGCAGFADMHAELALGVLTGRERAEALAHLERCAACQENVRQLTMKAEQLLQLLPAVEPPPGFETRVTERLCLAALSQSQGAGPGQASRVSLAGGGRRFAREAGSGGAGGSGGPAGSGGAGWPGRTRRVLAGVAVALVAALSALGGWGLGGWGLDDATSSTAGSSLTSAALLSASRQPVGTIFFYDGSQQWLSMSVNLHSGTGPVACQLLSSDGHVTTLGSFWVDAGYGAWASPGPVSHDQFTGARLVSADGTVLATASFPPR